MALIDYREADEGDLVTSVARLVAFAEAGNIIEALTEEQLKPIGPLVCQEFEIDANSRSEWAENAEKMMEAALQAKQAKSFPFEQASNIKYPLLTVAALQFNARAYPAICDDSMGIVKGRVIGDDDGIPEEVDEQTGEVVSWRVEPGAKRERADRIGEHMSWQLTDEMAEWEEDTDTLLIQLPILGCAFRKCYRGDDRNRAELVSAMDLVVNSRTRSLAEAPRITHCISLYPYEIEERIRDGRFAEFDYGIAADAMGDEEAPHEFLEQHRLIDLDGDGLREPYIVVVHRETQAVCRVAANFRPEDIVTDAERILRIRKKEYFVKYAFIPDPQGGFYDIGFGKLLENIGAAVNTTLNQMLDAGTLQNAGGGFIGSGLRLGKSEIRMEPGKYLTVQSSGSKIRESIYDMQHPGPSPVLFQLLGLLIDAAKDITAVKDVVTGDSGQRTQTATATLALIEQGLKVFTAIYKRVYRSLKAEFRLLYDLNAAHLPDEAYFNVLDTPKAVARADYRQGDMDVVPVADPSVVTDMQRIARANVVMETAAAAPGVVDIRAAVRRVFEAAGVDDIKELIPEPQPNPMEGAQVEMLLAELEKVRAETAETASDAELNQIQGVVEMIRAMHEGRKLDIEEARIKAA